MQMTGREYAQRKAGVAGAIKALASTGMPCKTDCAAHPVQVQTVALLAEGLAADAEFFGNGFSDEIASRVASKLNTPRGLTIGGRTIPEAILWRVAIILSVVLMGWLRGGKLDQDTLETAIRQASAQIQAEVKP